MKTIIAGSRHLENYEAFKAAFEMHCDWHPSEIVSGCAWGVDAMGERWAREKGIPVKQFPADWKTKGRGAGPIRNAQMAEYAEALFLYWNGESRGSANMLQQAKEKGLVWVEVIVAAD